MGNYWGITYPEKFDNIEALDEWKNKFCHQGWHLFDEVLSNEDHYLICDACELIVNIESIEK